MARSDRGARLDGIVVLAKPSGPTSHDVVGIVRRLTGVRRVGHGGTLDPFASGVLPVFLGLGTRMVEYHMRDAKSYRATVCFGARSTTDDRDGELAPSDSPPPTREQLEAALAEFRGEIEQRPPAFSALKVGGRRAYELAREGTQPELALRTVTITRLELIAWDASDEERPTATIEVDCSAGTYIRALARDLGDRLGGGAYLGALVRTASGPFTLHDAHSLDEFRAAASEGGARLRKLILPIDSGLEEIPSIKLESDELAAIARGQQIRGPRKLPLERDAVVRLVGPEGELAGMGTWRAGRIAPDKVFISAPGDEKHASGSGAGNGHASDAAVADRAADAGRRHVLHDPPVRVGSSGVAIQTVASIDGLTREMGPLYVAVGVFDGLHRGHLYLIRRLVEVARKRGARPAVITFDAHPEEVVLGIAPSLLCDPWERIVRLGAAGVELAVMQHFDRALRETEYDAFVEAIRDRVDLAGFLMTPDAAFGHGRRGTPDALRALGERDGFEVATVEPFLIDGRQVRSSDIRGAIEQGRLDDARRLLGRPLSVVGRPLPAAETAAVPIDFDVPVALPPPGTYEALSGPGWHMEAPPIPAVQPAQATVWGDPRRLSLSTEGTFPGELVRVVFGDRLD